jgi:chemotaxis protein CheZ
MTNPQPNKQPSGIFSEIDDIQGQINILKQEVYNLRTQKCAEDVIPGANSELKSITQETENAANEIMNNAEEIQNIAMTLGDETQKQQLIDNVTKIFEACNFQDITGQRIAKVVNALAAIENSITKLSKHLSDDLCQNAANPITPAINDDASLMNGPQLKPPSQDEIDDLFTKI